MASTFYGGMDPRDAPAYTIPRAARNLRLPEPTLRSWVKGYGYKTKGGPQRQPQVIITPVQTNPIYLSFTNLVEAHVLASIRRVHDIPLPRVRQALLYIAKEFGTPHPLANEDFQTDGVRLFLEKFGKLINVTDDGQVEIRMAFELGLKRIEYKGGLAGRLFPFMRDLTKSDQPRIIVIDPLVSFGRPTIDGTGVPVTELASRWRAGDSFEELAKDFRIDKTKVEEALRAAA